MLAWTFSAPRMDEESRHYSGPTRSERVCASGSSGYALKVEHPEVLLVPANPLDLRPEDLESLAIAIRGDHALTADVGVVPQRGYGVTWWEVLYIYLGTKGLDALTGHAFQLFLDGITEKAKQWYRGRRFRKTTTGPSTWASSMRRAGSFARSRFALTAPLRT